MVQNDLRRLFEEAETSQDRLEAITALIERKMPVVLHGAGGNGRRLAARMKADGQRIVCFADNDKKLQGTFMDGVRVLSLDEAVRRFAEEALFVVSIFNSAFDADYKAVKVGLQRLGAKHIISFPAVALRYAGDLLPHCMLGRPGDILPHREAAEQICGRLNDGRSRRVYVDMLRLSLTGDLEGIAPYDQERQYFIPEVLAALPDGPMVVADCGAYDGDTLRDFLDIIGPARLERYHAFEPDPANFSALKSFVSTLPAEVLAKISLRQAGVGAASAFVKFQAGTNMGSAVSAHGNITVEICALDDVFSESRCDFIKMDIEGHESEALKGAAETIAAHAPAMAVSAYHKSTDFLLLQHVTPPPPHVAQGEIHNAKSQAEHVRDGVVRVAS
jgi:FkbM family methyltransferase